MSQGGILNYVASTPSIPTSFSTDAGTAIPVANLLQILGGEGIDTSAAGNTITITGELATAAANVGLANIGVCAFDSADFVVVGGFVQIAHSFGGFLGILTDSGLPAVLPDIAGLVTFIGGNNITTIGGINTVTFDLTGTTASCVQVGNVGGSLTSIVAGLGGELLVGATGGDPAFSTIAYGNFSFSNLTPATPRILSVNNVDVNAASTADLRISVPPLGGDGMISWEVQGTLFYSAGVDNSVAGDPWVLSNSSSPSGGNALISTTSAGVITLFNDLDVTEGGTGVSTLTSHGILMGNGAGDINATAEPSNGQILIGKTGDFPQLAQLQPGMGIAVSNGAGTITISAWGGGVSWTVETVNLNFTANKGIIANKAGLLTVTLPATASIGDILEITGINTAIGWRVAQNANQRIHVGAVSSTIGVGGYVESVAIRDSLKLLCVVAGASTEWQSLSVIGNLTVV